MKLCAFCYSGLGDRLAALLRPCMSEHERRLDSDTFFWRLRAEARMVK